MIERFTRSLARLLRDDSGAAAIEYGIISALIAVAAIATLAAVGTGIDGVFDQICTQLDGIDGVDCTVPS